MLRKIALNSLLLLLFLATIISPQQVEGCENVQQVQVEAAALMLRCLEEIGMARELRGLPIDEELDPNRTGIIGEDITLLTTTLGHLAAKRTSSNPDFAALMVRFFTEAHLEPGDVVAIGASGSFPGLILAVTCAAEKMGLRSLVIYSIGSSMYGATNPDFTYMDMHDHLVQKDLLSPSLIGVSMGGFQDLAGGMIFPQSFEVIRGLALATDYEFIEENSLAKSVQRRLALYGECAADPIACFVNIGGASTNYGDTPDSLNFPNGLIRELPFESDDPERGLLYEYLLQGLPVINLLNVLELAQVYGLTIDPVPFPVLGESAVYDW